MLDPEIEKLTMSEDTKLASSSTMNFKVAPEEPLRAVNKRVACAPFEKTGVQANIKSGFATVKQKGTLVGMKVLFSNGTYFKGQTVYVKADLAFHPTIAEVYELNGQTMVFIPEDQIFLVDSRRS